MWIKKRILISDLAFGVRTSYLAADNARLLSTSSLPYTPGLSQDLSVEVYDAVESWVLDATIILGFAKRFVWGGPGLDFEATARQCLEGFARNYAARPTVLRSVEEVCKLTVSALGAALSADASNIPEFWKQQFAVGFPSEARNGPAFDHFGALVAHQNQLLVPLLDDVARKYRPRTARHTG
jgi:hypothetical protein